MTGGACEIPEAWGGSGPVFHGNLVHSWRTLIKLDGTLDFDGKSVPAKPEWFALITDWQGKPMRSTVQPCTRNPEVREAILRGALKHLRQHTNDLFVTVGQEDGPDFCHCTAFGCSELVAKEGSASSLVLELANEAADRVAKEFPGKQVMAPAYMWGLPLPKTLRPRDNVIMSVAPIDNDFGHPVASGIHEQNVKCRTAMEAWQTAAKQIWLWDYTCNFTHYLMPHPNLDVLAPNVRYYADHHVTGYMAQGSHTCVNAEFSHLRMWVLAKALWNPDVDNRTLVAEFCHGFYGPAGPAILRYIEAIHRPVRENAGLYVSCYNDFTVPWLAPEVLTEAEGSLREAEAAVAKDPVLLDRVRLAHVPLQYVLAVRQPSSTTWKQIEQRSGKINRTAFATSLADRLDQFFIKTGKPWGMDETGGRGFPEFVTYLRQWAAKAGPSGDALPPELRGVEDFRLIHPWQIEQQKLNWGNRPFADPEASDGWVMRAKDEGWTMSYNFVAGDDFTPGKRYTLFVRVQCPPPMTGGDAFACGIHGKEPLPRLDKTVPTSLLTPGRYQVVEIGTLEIEPGHAFWIALVKGKNGYAVPEVLLDCFWLRKAN
jgi:hypothetical protein